MTNDQRLDGFHNYRFEMYCADQAEITSLRTQLAEVARERDKLIGVLECSNRTAKRRGEELDRLRAALIDCAVPLEVLHAIDCELAPATQAGITAAIAAIRSALFSAQPEPKPEAPKPHVITRDDLTKAGPG